MNTITIEKMWPGENLTNRTSGDGPVDPDYSVWTKCMHTDK